MARLDPDLERIPSLPIWAQQHIARLNRKIGNLETEIAAVKEDDPTSSLQLYARGYLSKARGLDQHAALEWNIDGHEKIRVTLKDRGRESVLEIMGVNGPIVVRPRASNVVEVGMLDRE